MIAEAYEIMQRERCSQCGLPKWVCHNEEISHYTIDEDVCFARRELDDIDERRRAQTGGPKEKNGVQRSPRPYLGEGQVLDTDFREAFYRRSIEAAAPDA